MKTDNPTAGASDSAQHTTGPYIVTKASVAALASNRWFCYTYKGTRLVFQAFGASKEEATANAQLAAAAPELFAALGAISKLDYTRAAVNCCAYDAVQIARAALAKAKGAS